MKRPALAALCATTVLAACGGSDSTSSDTTSKQSSADAADLAAVKTYLTDHTARLTAASGAIREDAEAYYALAKAADFDYGRLLETKRDEVADLVERGQENFQEANPAYEEMEGVVAGVPSLADYDVSIDAGGDESDAESAVAFNIKTPAGKTYKQPGNFNFLIETTYFGTEPKFAAKGVEPDLDGDGKVEFGEAVPDADFLVATARAFEKEAKALDADAKAYEPTLQDAMTALVVMTPTMSEYFEAWKNSRFISGSKATETAFVAASRLQDIEDILSGLVLVYDNVEPSVAKVDAAQARQTRSSLKELRAFAARLRKQEQDGKTFTASDADTLGSEAQTQAEAIAGQISQAAGRLNIKLET